MGYTIFDALVLAALVISTILAWSRGLSREVLTIMGWIVAILVASRLSYTVVPLIRDIPFINSYFSDSCELLTAAGFVVVFVLSIIAASMVIPVLTDWVQASIFAAADEGLGALFGFFRGVLIGLVAVVVYDYFVASSSPLAFVENSKSYAIFSTPRSEVAERLPGRDVAPGWLSDQFDAMTARCPAA